MWIGGTSASPPRRVTASWDAADAGPDQTAKVSSGPQPIPPNLRLLRIRQRDEPRPAEMQVPWGSTHQEGGSRRTAAVDLQAPDPTIRRGQRHRPPPCAGRQHPSARSRWIQPEHGDARDHPSEGQAATTSPWSRIQATAAAPRRRHRNTPPPRCSPTAPPDPALARRLFAIWSSRAAQDAPRGRDAPPPPSRPSFARRRYGRRRGEVEAEEGRGGGG